MPYYITDNKSVTDCPEWAVIKVVDGKPEKVACHPDKKSASAHMVAMSLAEGMKPLGTYFPNTRAVDGGTYTPPAGVQSAAKRALKWISEGKAGSGFTSVGRNRASQLAAGNAVSARVINKMIAYFARHEVDKKAEGFNAGEKGFPSPGRVAWDAWGGDAGQSWVNGLNNNRSIERDSNVRALICDIDDTIIHHGQLIPDVVDFVESQDVAILLVTGRLESERAKTVDELRRLGMDYDQLIMNNLGSTGKSPEFKKQAAEKILKTYDVIFAIDNDGQARDAYASLGIHTINPANLPQARKELSKMEDDLMKESEMPKISKRDGVEAPTVEMAEPTKQDLAVELADLLGEVVAFKFLAHGFHWNVRGINFAQFHEFFGEIYEDADGSIDSIAENIRKLNYDAPFTLSTFMHSAAEMEATDSTDPLEMCRSLYIANEDVRECIVRALALADELEEQGIVNFLAERQDMHSKWQWQLRSIVGDSFAKSYEIDVEEVAEGTETGNGIETEPITGEDEGNPASAMTTPDGAPMQYNSSKERWATAAALIQRKLDPTQEIVLEGRTKKIETRLNHADCELRAVEGGDGMTFEGYAAVFNSPSEPIGGQFTEYVAPGAFKRSLTSHGYDIKLLWNHDTGQVLGSTRAGTLRLVEDSHGLKAIATLPDTQLGRDTATLLKRGDVANMSFGFTVPKGGDSWSADGSTRTLHNVKLAEVSVVAFPAYQATTATVRAETRAINTDVLAEGLMRLESGENLDNAQAEAIREVVAKLEQVAQDSSSDIDLKQKALELQMKRI